MTDTGPVYGLCKMRVAYWDVEINLDAALPVKRQNADHLLGPG